MIILKFDELQSLFIFIMTFGNKINFLWYLVGDTTFKKEFLYSELDDYANAVMKLLNNQLNIHAWNKEIFGTQAYTNGKNFKNQNIDLAIFGKLADLGDLTLAKASARCYQNFTTESGEVLTNEPGYGQPYVGVVQINKNINYNLPNSKEYFI